MDDGSLSITHRVNHRLKKIYLTPHVYLYLQSFSKSNLELLIHHFSKHFSVKLSLSKREDGFGFVMKTTSVEESFKFLQLIRPVILDCPSMFYKTNWNYRFTKELMKWSIRYPGYQVITSSSERSKNFSEDEINLLVKLKLIGNSDKFIGKMINRSHWSVVYKWRDVRLESIGLIARKSTV